MSDPQPPAQPSGFNAAPTPKPETSLPQPASVAPVNPAPAQPAVNKIGNFVIEDGIEIPPTGPPKKASEFGDVLKALKVGQSFTADEAKGQAIRSAAKNLSIRVAVRKANEGKVRVWRIEDKTEA